MGYIMSEIIHSEDLTPIWISSYSIRSPLNLLWDSEASQLHRNGKSFIMKGVEVERVKGIEPSLTL